MYYLEDLEDGREFKLGAIGVAKEHIIRFAKEFDPQAFHLDEEVAGRLFGGLIASGWHTTSLCNRLLVEGFLKQAACLASPGVDELRFIKPVYGGDVLTGSASVISTKKSKTKPDRGLAKIHAELFNGKNDLVLSMRAMLIIGCRPPVS